MELLDTLLRWTPGTEQEARDLPFLIAQLQSGADVFSRRSPAHFTASAWIVSPDRQQVLMVYHNIYNSWAWTGGHADGDSDLFAVARREAMEETGIAHLPPLSREPVSVEILTVDGHIKRGEYVSSHLHLNVTYLFEADPADPIRPKPDENSGAAWIPATELAQRVSEPWMLRWIYSKLQDKVEKLPG